MKENWESAERKRKEESAQYMEEMRRRVEAKQKAKQSCVKRRESTERELQKESYRKPSRAVIREEERVREEETLTVTLRIEEDGPFTIKHKVTFLY